MQNYNNPMQPQGGYGAPPPPPPIKKGMSTGIKVLIAAAVLLVIGGALIVALGIGGIFWFSRQAREAASVNPAAKYGQGGGGGSSSSSSSSAAGEAPVPTSEQAAAIAGGQTATWEQQEISWTVPQKWKKNSADSTSFMWRSPGSWDAASLIVSVSPLGTDFPVDASLKAYWAGAQQDKLSGKYAEARLIKFGGISGVMFRESAPEESDSPQRLQWIGYRIYKGQTQQVNIMLASQGKYFAQHEDAMYGILYSTKLGQ